MNKQRRRELNKIACKIESIYFPVNIAKLDFIKNNIEIILMDEEMAFENMPEGLQMSYRGTTSQEAQSSMAEAIDLIDEFINDYQEYEINKNYHSNEDEDEDEEDIESEIEDRLQDLISEVVEYLETAAE